MRFRDLHGKCKTIGVFKGDQNFHHEQRSNEYVWINIVHKKRNLLSSQNIFSFRFMPKLHESFFSKTRSRKERRCKVHQHGAERGLVSDEKVETTLSRKGKSRRKIISIHHHLSSSTLLLTQQHTEYYRAFCCI